MSAMPIREALRRLDAAGLVENIPHRGARVTELSIADLAEVYEARLALEPLAVRRAAERFTPAHAAHRDRAAARRSNALADDNSPETWAAHTAFHFALYDAAESVWLDAPDPPAVGDEPALPPRRHRRPQARHAPQRARRDPAGLHRPRRRPRRGMRCTST